MLHHLSIRSFRLLLTTIASCACHTTLGDKPPAGVLPPIRYQLVLVHHQLDYLGPSTTDVCSRFDGKPIYFLATTKRPRRHRQRRPLRPLDTGHCSRRGSRPTLSSPTSNNPGVATTDDYIEPPSTNIPASALTSTPQAQDTHRHGHCPRLHRRTLVGLYSANHRVYMHNAEKALFTDTATIDICSDQRKTSACARWTICSDIYHTNTPIRIHQALFARQ